MHRTVSVDASSKLVRYLQKNLEKLGYYTVRKGVSEAPGTVNVFVIDTKEESADGRPLYKDGIPVLYYNTGDEPVEITADDLISTNDDDGSGSDDDDEGSDDDDEGSDDGEEEDDDDDGSISGSESEGSDDEDDEEEMLPAQPKVADKPQRNDAKLRKTARAIADSIKDMHIAYDKEDLVDKIHQLGDIVLAKAYTRTVFDSSTRFASEQERQQCKAGVDSVPLDLVFLDVAKRMPPISR